MMRSSSRQAHKPYLRDNPNATVQLLDTGHFALETDVEEIAKAMREFLARNVQASSKARAS